MLQAFRRVAEEEMKVRAAGLPKREDLMVHKLQELCVMAVREPSRGKSRRSHRTISLT